MRLTGADPIAYAREPFWISRGFGVNEKTRLLAPIAEGSESIVPVLAPTALPISFSSFSHSVCFYSFSFLFLWIVDGDIWLKSLVFFWISAFSGYGKRSLVSDSASQKTMLETGLEDRTSVALYLPPGPLRFGFKIIIYLIVLPIINFYNSSFRVI